MPRQGRINVEGGIYHVIQRGLERREIFHDEKDREEFLRRLSEGLEKTKHKCYGWVLMPNHFHLLIRTGLKPLSDLMRKLLTGYAIYFNRKYKRSGYLYQGRYKSILCQEDSYLLELTRYIHLNPIRAKIIQDMIGLRTYKWSGHSVIMGKKEAKWQSTGEILGYFGKKRSQAIRRYEEFVAEAKGMEKRKDLTGGGLIRSAGGWVELLKMRRGKSRMLADERILGDGEFVEGVLKGADEQMARRDKLLKDGWDIDKIVMKACAVLKIDQEAIRTKKKRKEIGKARSLISFWAVKELGMTCAEVGRYFGITKQAVANLVDKGEKVSTQLNVLLSN